MNTVILLAAGKSERAGQNKLWADVHGKPLWTLSHETFKAHSEIGRIVLVVPKGDEFRFLPFIDGENTQLTTGGATRMESFKRGLAAADFKDTDMVIDHNAANPKVTAREISEVIAAAKKTGAAAVCHRVVDTLIELNESGLTNKNRENFRIMQTPQAVRSDILKNLELENATDLTTALIGHAEIELVPASPANKKITFAEDLESLRAQTYLGEDSHSFSETGILILGGLKVAGLPALEANSDGDVILHAIGRALAQACGENFSELADPLSLSGNSDSRDYLEPLLEKVKITNLSISLECARPRIDPLIPDIKSVLERILQVQSCKIQISAHTGEGLTAFGRGEGIRCLALVTLYKC
mgnify:CR=1 FL=1